MKKREMVNIIRSDARPIEGEEYYFTTSHDEMIHRGTCVNCEECFKHCIVNAYGITSFNQPVTTITVNSYLQDADELRHCDALEMAVCTDCYIPMQDEE